MSIKIAFFLLLSEKIFRDSSKKTIHTSAQLYFSLSLPRVVTGSVTWSHQTWVRLKLPTVSHMTVTRIYSFVPTEAKNAHQEGWLGGAGAQGGFGAAHSLSCCRAQPEEPGWGRTLGDPGSSWQGKPPRGQALNKEQCTGVNGITAIPSSWKGGLEGL